jgi:hypothetical protein
VLKVTGKTLCVEGDGEDSSPAAVGSWQIPYIAYISVTDVGSGANALWQVCVQNKLHPDSMLMWHTVLVANRAC